MAYRNGTYVAFHAAGTSDPTASDMKYYALLKAWHVRDDDDFSFVNSHEKTAAVRDSSSKERLKAVLSERLRNSKNMILVLGETTRFDTDWVPYEISYGIDQCGLPIIATYPGYEYILNPSALSAMWPAALHQRITSGAAHVIHIPFKKEPLADAVSQFNLSTFPLNGGLGYYSRDAYRSFGISIS